ncbi:MAG: HAD family hydrolase [Microcella sp.]|uniref:HAD family hydrolase n=1 Tax=Microcella sp. TaxID=1913979 RepID=UPI0033164430
MTARSSSAIRVVLFDLDDTLMAHTRAVDLAIERAQEIAGGGFAADDRAAVRSRWRELEERHYARYLSGELDNLGQRIHRARDLHAPYGIDLDDEAALGWFAEYLDGYRNNWTLFDDVLPALHQLEATIDGVRFGIITNGDLAFQTDKLERIALWERLELTAVRRDGSVDHATRRGRVVASGELGTPKPDPAIFDAAAAALDVAPSSCAYIGDRVRTDAVGAHEAGMLGIWLDRGEARNDTTAEAHVTLPAGVPSIRSLLDLPALLSR